MNFRIRTRLMLTYLLLIFISMLILGLAMLGSIQDHYLNYLKNEMGKEAELVNEIIAPLMFNGDLVGLKNISGELGNKIKTRISIIDKQGVVLGDSSYNIEKMENHKDRPEIKKALQGSKGVATRYSTTLENQTMYLALPIEVGNDVLGVVRLSLSLKDINENILKLKLILLLSILLATIVVTLISYYLAKGITRPIEDISLKASQIAQGDFKQRIFSSSQDELGKLARDINNMSSALENKMLEITANQKRLKAILNHIASGVLVIDILGKIQVINPTAQKMFGFFDNKTVGINYQSIIRNFTLQESIEQTIKTAETNTCEFFTIYPQKYYLKAYITPVVQENKINQIVIVFHDITSLRKLEKMKTDFVANASHELRTPVSAIKGFAETLLDGAMEDEKLRDKFMGIIDKEAERLIRLINDLLDLSKLEEKQEKIFTEKFNIVDLLKECKTNFLIYAREKDISLEFICEEDFLEVEGNRDLLKQAFINLIENSIKYTPHGGEVYLKLWQENSLLKISIRDTGVGIPSEDIPRIFERFYRVDKARSREIGGTGLGLSIVKHILELHKAKIYVESQENKGSTFTVAFRI